MTRKEPLWNKISAPSVLLVLTALFTGLFIAPSFDSARPRTAALAWDPVNVVGKADGLITFDPLEQAYGKLGTAQPWIDGSVDQRARFSVDALAAGLARGAAADGRWLVLLESVRGGTLSEDHERRLRGRYATAAALVREGLYPRQSKRLNLCWFSPPEAAQFADPDRGGVLVPYEFFDAAAGDSTSYARVCVCWIDEAAIERDPMRFGLAFERALDSALLSAQAARSRVDLCWLGPTTSGRLRELVSSFKALDPSARAASRLKIATPYATSPKVALPGESAPGASELADAPWSGPGLAIRRAVNTDLVLARLLIAEFLARVPALLPMNEPLDSTRELASPAWLRLVAAPVRALGFIPPKPSNRPVRVALITEQDSTYGQSWLDNMQTARRELSGAEEAPRHPQLAALEFTVFPVFGWVDALVRESKDNAAATSVSRDYPAEAHQLDYLGRLRDEIAVEGRFDAICVFVTEEYDTMMILEALRPKFPGATFFTTDLDARYLHPRHAPFTRNLVVASHFGLTPASADSGAAASVRHASPEFRDGYQTGVYTAVRALARQREPRPPATAGIYEIGRTRIVELNSASRADSAEPVVQARADERTQLENFASELRGWLTGAEVNAAARVDGAGAASASAGPSRPATFIYVWAAASIAALLLALLVFAVRPRRLDSRRRRSDARVALAFLSVVAPALGLLLLLGVLADAEARYVAEPLYLFQGVSSWPTFGLRAVTAVVCVVALISIELRLRRYGSTIESERGVANASAVSALWVVDWSAFEAWRAAYADARGQSFGARFRAALRAAVEDVRGGSERDSQAAADASSGAHDIDELWAFLCRSVRRPAWTALRVLLVALALYFAIAPFFILAPPPPSPVRGELAYLLDRLTLFASVFLFLMLMVRVMEVSFFACRAIGRVVDPKAITLSERVGDVVTSGRERLELAKRIASAVEPLVWGPMAALGLMIGSRASVFDAWPWPSVLMTVFALFFTMLLLAILGMRRQCERARTSVLGSLDHARERCADDEAASRRLAALRDEIEALSGGAFSPLVQHPLLRALALPLAAFGANLAFERNLLENLLGSL